MVFFTCFWMYRRLLCVLLLEGRKGGPPVTKMTTSTFMRVENAKERTIHPQSNFIGLWNSPIFD